MLTGRGWWLVVAAAGVLLVGLVARLPLLSLTGTALACWFAWEWLLFAGRVGSIRRRLHVRREVRDDKGPVATLWAGRSFRVQVVVAARGLRLAHVAIRDLVPFGLEREGGEADTQGPVDDQQSLHLDYRVRCDRPGRVRFEGVRLQTADLQGFFYHAAFLPDPLELLILPALVDQEGRPASKKRYNLLVPPGVHRLRAPGSGSELLDLRDYLPGDPPKTIAWKVSARRDRLITKEFESEVPVRCTLFLDASASVRVMTPSGSALTRLAEIAAGIVQSASAVRDPTGLCLFDENGVTSWVRPDRSPRHLTVVLRLLAETAGLPQAPAATVPDPLIPLGYAFAREVYPHLLASSINTMPLWAYWVAAFPGHRRFSVSLLDTLHRYKARLFTLGAFIIPTCLFVLNLVLVFSGAFTPETAGILLLASWAISVTASGLVVLLFAFSTLVSERLRRLSRWRKELAAILSMRYVRVPGGLAALLEDDDQFALTLQRFLSDHRVPYSVALYDPEGRYLFAAPGKVEVLANALLRAVGKGRDNELFVLMADLLELDDQLLPLVRATRVALARHHQVVLLCPWPADLDRPEREPPAAGPESEKPAVPVEEMVRRSNRQRFHTAFHRLRRTFARLGVSVVCAAGNEAVPLVLERMERLHRAGRKS
jgi:uncharacterized protein (DUF58 family)